MRNYLNRLKRLVSLNKGCGSYKEGMVYHQTPTISYFPARGFGKTYAVASSVPDGGTIVDLLKKAGTSPRFHGNGFTQLYLSADIRLHVWHPSIAPLRQHNAMIHNHRYDVRSTVYSGRLKHTTYLVDDTAPKDKHDVRVIQLDGASGAHKSPEIETGKTGALVLRHEYELTQGAVYTMRRPWLHTSEHVGQEPIVTIFERSNKGDDWAQVICGINDPQATHAFAPETQPSEEQLWAAIEDAVGYVGEEFVSRVQGIIEGRPSGI